MKKVFLFLVISFITFSLLLSQESYAGINPNVPIPDITALYVQDGKVKVEWSTDIAPQDVMYKTGFEINDERPRLTYFQGSTGGQSFSTEDKYEGDYSLRVENTYVNGNWRNDPREPVLRSIAIFARKYAPNGAPISITFHAKTTTKGIVGFNGDGGWSNSIQEWPDVYLIKDANPGDDKIYLNKIPPGLTTSYGFTTDTDPNVIQKVFVTFSIDKNNNAIILRYDTPIDRYIPAGTPFKTRIWRGAWSFGSRTIDKDDGWKRFSINTYVTNYPDYDVLVRGGTLYIWTQTDGVIYVDNIKFGFASKAQLFRDNKLVYEGYLSDFLDSEAVDRAKPEPINNINISNEGNKIKVSWTQPKDNGTIYMYQIRGVSSSGDYSPLSDPRYITVTSGIKGYYIKVDQNPNNTISGASFVSVNNFEYTAPNTGKYYIHIAVVDNMGNVSDVKTFSYSIPWLKATPVPAENAVQLNWGIDDDSQTYSYMVYKRDISEPYFQTIPVKDNLKVLNVYPYIPILEEWMKNYGRGKISVDSVPIENFNNNPSIIWNYDVAVFGFSDSNSSKDISIQARDELIKYIESGRGVLFGHDTIRIFALPNFTSLAKYVNIQSFDSSSGIPWFNGYMGDGTEGNAWSGHSLVRITKKGLLTNYPWHIGDLGTDLVVPYTHDVYQIANGDIWMKFVDPKDPDMTHKGNFYLTTWNNTAMIQTGHSILPGVPVTQYATEDEQKLIANTIFYLGQVTTGTSWIDHSAQDLTPPDPVKNIAVSQENNQITINWAIPKDNGTTYEYYVQATGSYENLKRVSDTVTATITTGIKGYAYVIDQNPSTEPGNTINTISNKITISINKEGTYYIHIKAIDNAGNASETTHYRFYVYPVVELKPGGDNGLYTDKGTYRAGEGIVLKMNASGPVYKITAVVWYNGNEFIQQKETELQKVSDNLWISRKYDKVLIIPRNMPDGTYNIVLNVYIRYSNGIEETKQIDVPVTVKGTIFDDYKSTITK